jgi:hypothetical protein
MSRIVYYFFSKYSPACARFQPILQQLSTSFQIVSVDVDDTRLRQRLRNTNIKTVPALVVPTQNSLEIFEGQELLQFVQKVQEMFAPSNQQTQLQPNNGQTVLFPAPPQVAVQPQMQSIVNPAVALSPQPVAIEKQQMNATASINQRLQPQVITSPPPAQPMLTTQIANTNINAQAAQLQQQQQQAQAPPIQAAQTMQSQMIDDSVLSSNGGDNTFSKGGMSMMEITGGHSMSRMNNDTANGGGAVAQAQAMMAQRDQEVAASDPRKNANAAMLQQAMSQPVQQQYNPMNPGAEIADMVPRV